MAKRMTPKDRVNQDNQQKETTDSVYNFTVVDEEKQTDEHTDIQTNKHENTQTNKQEDESESDKIELKRQTYYISEDLIEALTMKVFMERDKKIDKSQIVREALYAYIEDKYFVK